jgi:hypothetical protein
VQKLVLPGKVFKLREAATFAALTEKLQGYRVVEVFAEGQQDFDLVTEITNLSQGGKSLTGLYSHDTVSYVYHRGKRVPTPATTEAMFNFTAREGEVLLSVLQEKWTAGRIANEFSKILFERKGRITEAEIPPDSLRSFHEQNPGGTKVAFFEGMGIPNLDKLSLYGPDLIETDLFDEYASRGNLWYIVMTSKRHGHVVGITRNAIVVIFNKVTPKEYLNYIADEVFPLIV